MTNPLQSTRFRFIEPVLFAALCIPLCVLKVASQPLPASSETATANWERIKALAPGTKVLISPNRPGNVSGKLEAVTEDCILIRSGKRQESVLREEIEGISVRVSRRKKHVVSSVKWGALVGAGVGAVIGGLCDEGSGSHAACRAGIIAIGAGEFAGLGAVLGALSPSGEWREIYRR